MLHRKKCPHMVHIFNVPHDWFEINSRHQKRYSEDGKKILWVLRSTGKSNNSLYVNNSHHLVQKYARMFVCGHYLFREAQF